MLPHHSITVDGLTVRRGQRTVLKDFNAVIASGTVTGLLGPSGAGKTTLIRAIVGAQKTRSGNVWVDGHKAGSKPLRRSIGYVSQENAVYPDLTVQGNVSYFASLFGRNRVAVDETLEQVGMTDHADQRADRLSGGQKTRTSLACALVADPSILVLDEPTVGLDPLLREELWNHFRDLSSAGKTLVVSSHVMDEADRCDHILLLREGELVADAEPHDLKRRTATGNLDDAFLTLIKQTRPVSNEGEN
ncbi:ABC transporter ATP-binding protein [Haloglycomyces albus]|uniref:ABC transporter ATP-binding protein n=1 Tax=Haloglycomyces albus TaxID=526067 RepID=UPI0004A431DE|nr:ABC transporter ATP-binding protein [Haloglycomyces albus]